MRDYISVVFLILLSFLSLNCNNNRHSNQDSVVIGISSDIETLTPLYSFNLNESYITDMLYLSLIRHDWNENLGELLDSPMLAKKWEWNKDSTTVTLWLREDVRWSDGQKVTAEDVVYSFDLYSDPDVKSRFLGTFRNLYTDKDDRIDLARTFEIVDPYKLIIHFNDDIAPSLLPIDVPILPKHVYSKIERKDVENSDINLSPVSNGLYKLKSWKKNQEIILEADNTSFLYNTNSIHRFIFKIVPLYNTRLQQMKNGELDLITNVSPDDAASLKKGNHINLLPVKGREYDYIGWNNLDPGRSDKMKKKIAHPLFGNPEIRKALTYSLNRQEVIENFLYNYGQAAVSPVAPIFRSIYDKSITPYEYNPDKAKAIFARQGWLQSATDGILEKNGVKFRFKVYMAAGNPRRDFAMSIFKNNLKAVGVDIQIEKMEMASFIRDLFSRKFDAWAAGWSITIPVELRPFWHSNPDVAFFNLAGYENKSVNNLLDELETVNSKIRRTEILKKLQNIIHNDAPFSFLYWVDNIVAYNKKIKNIEINPLGAVNKPWNWEIQYD